VKGEASIPILLAPPGRVGTDVPAFRSEVERDVHYQKASELRLLRRDADAARELLWLTERYARDQPGALVLSSLLSDAGAHSEALRLARLTFRDVLERGGGDQVPPALWAVAYPAVYLPSIRVHASARLDPYLAAAIIREESQYDTRAVSRVGAIGLMQLMPETARSLARPLGTDVVRDELFDQETNIRYGTRYLDQLLDQFSDQAVHAIAAYNAGPVAVSSWIAKNGAADWEEFVEMIPYQETRQYVKRVLRSYWEYRRVYGAPCRERLLDKVC
jgi:soluble lytic murein transglycosylase